MCRYGKARRKYMQSVMLMAYRGTFRFGECKISSNLLQFLRPYRDRAIKSWVSAQVRRDEAGAHRERTHSDMLSAMPLSIRDAGKDFRSVSSRSFRDNANDLASMYVEGNIPKSPEGIGIFSVSVSMGQRSNCPNGLCQSRGNRTSEGSVLLLTSAYAITLAQTFNLNGCVTHRLYNVSKRSFHSRKEKLTTS